MRWKHELRHLVQRFGFDIVPYPLHEPLARTVRLMQHHQIDCVVDVGANDGGFAEGIRGLGYTGRIISFEPLQQPFEVLRRKSADDDNWEAVRCAVGSTQDVVTINVAGNDGLSSSVLPMLDAHTEVAPTSRYVRSEEVTQERLDDVLPQLGVTADNRVFLKIDVQGYERAVLDGASALFEDSAIAGMQLELSFVPLYSGGMLYRESLDRAEQLGMALMGLTAAFDNPKTGQLLQADAVFFRAEKL